MLIAVHRLGMSQPTSHLAGEPSLPVTKNVPKRRLLEYDAPDPRVRISDMGHLDGCLLNVLKY